VPGRLPTFVIIGAAKCGTTSLAQQLSQHPEVFMAADKEPNFFIEQLTWSKGLDWYRSLFADAGQAKAVGEASTMYTDFPESAGAAARMAGVIPDAKLVYVVREPIARMKSLYSWYVQAGFETRSITEALLLDARYTRSTSYAFQLDQFLAHFDCDQILVVKVEDLRRDRKRFLAQICEFIGVDPSWSSGTIEIESNTFDDLRVPRAWWRAVGALVLRTHTERFVPDVVVRHNRSSLVAKPIPSHQLELLPEHEAMLREILRPDLERLADLLGPSFEGWTSAQQG
jgi:hypothetical protein